MRIQYSIYILVFIGQNRYQILLTSQFPAYRTYFIQGFVFFLDKYWKYFKLVNYYSIIIITILYYTTIIILRVNDEIWSNLVEYFVSSFRTYKSLCIVVLIISALKLKRCLYLGAFIKATNFQIKVRP